MSFKASIAGLQSRRAAWHVLNAVGAGAYADVAIERAFKKFPLSNVDRRLVTEISYGAIRHRYLLDRWLDSFGKLPAKKQPPQLRWLIHLALYQLLQMERIPPSAAVNTTVELAKSSDLSHLASVVNGILRSVIRAREKGFEIPLPSKPASKLSQLHSLPIWLVENLISWKGANVAEEIAEASNQTPLCDLRINRLRSSPEFMKQALSDVGFESIDIEGCPNGLQVILGCGDLREWPGYKEGYWCVQDRAAQCISPLLAPKPGDHVLDACAAPGGKATHLVELIGAKGEVWAVDRSKDRLKRVSENACRLGFTSLNLLEADSSSLLQVKPEWNGYFQRILLDAPCSGLGTLARHPDARWRICPEQINELVDLQAKLFSGLLPLLSPGGRIVYSTCTINPYENEYQIEKFLGLYPELVLVEEKQLPPNNVKGGDGFYAAAIQFK